MTLHPKLSLPTPVHNWFPKLLRVVKNRRGEGRMLDALAFYSKETVYLLFGFGPLKFFLRSHLNSLFISSFQAKCSLLNLWYINSMYVMHVMLFYIHLCSDRMKKFSWHDISTVICVFHCRRITDPPWLLALHWIRQFYSCKHWFLILILKLTYAKTTVRWGRQVYYKLRSQITFLTTENLHALFRVYMVM